MKRRSFLSTYLKTVEVNLQSAIFKKDYPHVQISRDPLCIDVQTVDQSIMTTSINRWKRYVGGINNRKKRLIEKFQADKECNQFENIVDVGANIGEFSIGMAEKGARVFAIEPDPITLYCLLKNTHIHENIIVLNELLWSEEAIVEFSIKYESADSSIISDDVNTMKFSRMTSTLDTICKRLSLETIHFLKADCEGAEPELLLGGREILDRTMKVAIDTGAERLGKTTYRECEEILKKSGFSVKTILFDEKETVTLGWRD